MWPLGAVCKRSWGLLEHLGSHLGPSWAASNHRRLYEARWGFNGGGVSPPPKGKREGWKRKRSKSPTPGGLVGLP
eukprot:8074463-Pyramimonas_sp.AAC.1